MVWIFRPPGVSKARAKSRRATAISFGIRPASLDCRDRGAKLVVGHRRPVGKLLEDALGHLRGGRLGEGETEDAAGVAAGE